MTERNSQTWCTLINQPFLMRKVDVVSDVFAGIMNPWHREFPATSVTLTCAPPPPYNALVVKHKPRKHPSTITAMSPISEHTVNLTSDGVPQFVLN